MTDLLSLTPDELTALLLDIGEPKYRAAQMFPSCTAAYRRTK